MRNVPVVLLAVAVATVSLFASACSKNDPVGAPEMEEVGNTAVPADAMAFITTKSMTDLKSMSGDIAGSLGGSDGSGQNLANLVQKKLLGTPDLEWMSMTRPLKAILLDPAKFGRPFVTMAPLESKKGLMATLNNVKKDVSGNDVEFTDADGKTRYLNFVGKNAVFTMDAGAFPASRQFVEGDLLKYPATQVLDIQTTSKSVTNVIKPLATLGMSNVLKQFPQIGVMTTMAVQRLVEFLDDLGRIRIVAAFTGGNLTIEASAVPLDGSAMARAAAGAKDRKLTLINRSPGEGWLEIAANADPDDAGDTIQNALNSIVGVIGLSGDVKDVYPKLLKDIVSSMTGESLVWIGWEGEFPLRTVMIAGLTSSTAAKTASEQMFSLILGEFGKKIGVLVPAGPAPQPAAEVGRSHVGAAPAAPTPATRDLSKLDWTSFENLLKSSGDMLSSSGVAVELKKDAADGVEVSHLEFTIDRTRLAAAEPGTARFNNLLGDRLSLGTAFDENNFYAAIGSDSVKEIHSARKEGKGSEKLARLVADAGFDVTWAMRVSLVDVGRVATAGYQRLVNALVPGLATMTTSPDLSMVSGSRGGRVVVGRISIPVSGIADLRKPASTPPAP